MAKLVPWEALKPNSASDLYIYGDILFCKISSNYFEAAVGSAIGLYFILSEGIKALFLIIGTSKTFISSPGKKVLHNISLNRYASTRKRVGDPYL